MLTHVYPGCISNSSNIPVSEASSPTHFLLYSASSKVVRTHTLKNYQPYWRSAILRYFSARKGLLVNRLVEEIKGLDPGRTEPIELVSYYLFYYLYLWWFFDMCLSIQSDTIGV